MKIERMSIWIGLTANLSVLFGIVILVVELNQNTQVAKATAWQEVTGRLIELEQTRSTDREVAEIILKARSSESLDELEELRYGSYVRSHIILGILAYTQYSEGLINFGQLGGILAPIRSVLRTEAGKKIWLSDRGGLASGFVEEIENLMRQSEPNADFWK